VQIQVVPRDQQFVTRVQDFNQRLRERGRSRDSRTAEHRQRGDMRVRSIADCLRLAQHPELVARTDDAHLEEQRVDIIVSAASTAHWCGASPSGATCRDRQILPSRRHSPWPNCRCLSSTPFAESASIAWMAKDRSTCRVYVANAIGALGRLS